MADALRPTVFILSNMREFGGAERSIGTLMPYLAAAAEVRVFVENDQHFQLLSRIQNPRLRLVRTAKGNSPLAFARTLSLLLYYFVKERPQALLANGHKGAVMLALLSCVTFWASPRRGVIIRDPSYDHLGFVVRRLKDAVFFAPTQMIFELQPYLDRGLGRCRTEVIPNAVEIPESAPESAVENANYIGCCARIVPMKGIQLLIRAYGLLAAEFSTVRLHVFGDVIDQEYFKTLTDLVAELGLVERVAFIPFMADVEEIYRGGLFFVIPTLSILGGPESFSRIIIESWAHRKPAVSFACGGPRYLIEEGTDGYLVEEGDVAALADRMRRLLADPARRVRMGQSGYEKVREKYVPEKVAARLLERLLADPHAPNP